MHEVSVTYVKLRMSFLSLNLLLELLYHSCLMPSKDNLRSSLFFRSPFFFFAPQLTERLEELREGGKGK